MYNIINVVSSESQMTGNYALCIMNYAFLLN